jgi:hypothetical protein
MEESTPPGAAIAICLSDGLAKGLAQQELALLLYALFTLQDGMDKRDRPPAAQTLNMLYREASCAYSK